MTKVRFPYHLTYLDLSHNHIKGGVSKFLKDIKLGHFNVSYNDLCGEIPTERFMIYYGADSYVHNKCLSGKDGNGYEIPAYPRVRNPAGADSGASLNPRAWVRAGFKTQWIFVNG